MSDINTNLSLDTDKRVDIVVHPSVVKDVGFISAAIFEDICSVGNCSIMRENGFFEYGNTRDMAKKFGLTYESVRRNTQRLVDKGYIEKKPGTIRGTSIQTILVKILRQVEGGENG